MKNNNNFNTHVEDYVFRKIIFSYSINKPKKIRPCVIIKDGHLVWLRDHISVIPQPFKK
jgi:hypothetical protein